MFTLNNKEREETTFRLNFIILQFYLAKSVTEPADFRYAACREYLFSEENRSK